ncbi:AraC family transcriptional regulator [Paenibacillus thermotolerans]|uniref:AraC family transcriptional regulator n=1 Tax=Paenibacillus thermotolerans TaxID=3027807 RepID=UPI0023681737|nr:MULTISPECIES: AraC family transcriptional regulator [unclassified Paenibacillus]
MIRVQTLRQDSVMDWYEEKTDGNRADYYFCIVTYGKCVYWIDDKKVVAEKGDLLLFPKGAYFYGKSIPTVFHTKTVATFILTSDSPILPVLNCKEHIHSKKIGSYELIHERMKQLSHQWIEKTPYYDVFASALLLEVLTRWNQELDRGAIHSEKYGSVDLMKKYIQENYRGKITKNVLGDAIRKSPNYAATLFSKTTGQTISEYVHSLRIKTAIYMLRESQLTVSEISEYLGYSDVSFFNKTFRRLTGVPPSHYLSERSSLRR